MAFLDKVSKWFAKNFVEDDDCAETILETHDEKEFDVAFFCDGDLLQQEDPEPLCWFRIKDSSKNVKKDVLSDVLMKVMQHLSFEEELSFFEFESKFYVYLPRIPNNKTCQLIYSYYTGNGMNKNG